MLNVSKDASEQVAQYFKDNPVKPIRIFLNEGGCCGPSIAMAIDEAKPTDTVYKVDEFEYVVDTAFMEKAQTIEVEFKESGFTINSGYTFEPAEDGCSGCHGSCDTE
jgi:iron-sulfur cluster assembly protein